MRAQHVGLEARACFDPCLRELASLEPCKVGPHDRVVEPQVGVGNPDKRSLRQQQIGVSANEPRSLKNQERMTKRGLVALHR